MGNVVQTSLKLYVTMETAGRVVEYPLVSVVCHCKSRDIKTATVPTGQTY